MRNVIIATRIARWYYVLKPKIPNWVNFRGSCAGWCGYFLGPFGLFYVRSSGILCGQLVRLSPFWYVVPRKIWQPWLQCFVVISDKTLYVGIGSEEPSKQPFPRWQNMTITATEITQIKNMVATFHDIYFYFFRLWENSSFSVSKWFCRQLGRHQEM
jgi:hypothetical protein